MATTTTTTTRTLHLFEHIELLSQLKIDRLIIHKNNIMSSAAWLLEMGEEKRVEEDD